MKKWISCVLCCVAMLDTTNANQSQAVTLAVTAPVLKSITINPTSTIISLGPVGGQPGSQTFTFTGQPSLPDSVEIECSSLRDEQFIQLAGNDGCSPIAHAVGSTTVTGTAQDKSNHAPLSYNGNQIISTANITVIPGITVTIPSSPAKNSGNPVLTMNYMQNTVTGSFTVTPNPTASTNVENVSVTGLPPQLIATGVNADGSSCMGSNNQLKGPCTITITNKTGMQINAQQNPLTFPIQFTIKAQYPVNGVSPTPTTNTVITDVSPLALTAMSKPMNPSPAGAGMMMVDGCDGMLWSTMAVTNISGAALSLDVPSPQVKLGNNLSGLSKYNGCVGIQSFQPYTTCAIEFSGTVTAGKGDVITVSYKDIQSSKNPLINAAMLIGVASTMNPASFPPPGYAFNSTTTNGEFVLVVNSTCNIVILGQPNSNVNPISNGAWILNNTYQNTKIGLPNNVSIPGTGGGSGAFNSISIVYADSTTQTPPVKVNTGYAAGYCNQYSNNESPNSTWYLPSVAELYLLHDTNLSYLEKFYFAEQLGQTLWTSHEEIIPYHQTSNALAIKFDSKTTGEAEQISVNKTMSSSFICVRSLTF